MLIVNKSHLQITSLDYKYILWNEGMKHSISLLVIEINIPIKKNASIMVYKVHSLKQHNKSHSNENYPVKIKMSFILKLLLFSAISQMVHSSFGRCLFIFLIIKEVWTCLIVKSVLNNFSRCKYCSFGTTFAKFRTNVKT